METAEIRRRFLAHFENAGHTVVPSAPLVFDDPNLLFVNAGMVPFKPYFLQQETPPFDRAVSVQKCVRTLDIEEVGKTTRHGTFFQMNGNFSFGDYFKEGAIEHAWNLVTGSLDDGGYGFDPDAVWVTVLEGDDEARQIWQRRHRPARRAHPEPRPARQLLAHGRARPRRPLQRDLRRPRAGVRPRRRPGRRRGPVPGDLEPRVHAGGDHQRPGQGRLRGRRAAAQPEHRHRHGPGAGRLPAAGQEQHVRDRRDLPRHREGVRPERPPLRRRPRRRRAFPRHRRPRPQRVDADRRRRHARQRGPRLRPAATAASRGPIDAAARLRRPRPARAAAREPRAHEGVLPRARTRLRPHLAGRVRRGGGVPPDPRQGHHDLRPRGRPRQERRHAV